MNSAKNSQILGVFPTFLMQIPSFSDFQARIFRFQVDSWFSRSPDYHDIYISFFIKLYKSDSKIELKLSTNQTKLKASVSKGAYARSLIYITQATNVIFE